MRRELLPHLGWEAVLLLGTVGVVAGLLSANDSVFDKGMAWPSLAVLGFAATGLALSLRTATPNLAIGQTAALAGWLFAKMSADDTPTATAFLLAVLAAAGVGVVLALLVGFTALPAWAVTLGAGVIVQASLLRGGAPRPVPIGGDRPSSSDFLLWVALFVVLSIGGALLFAVPAVRRNLSAARPTGEDPAAWRPAKLVGALVGLIGSATLAGVAGVLQARYVGAGNPIDSGLLPYAFAAVLLGGVSVFGRRAGILGVVLGVLVVDFTRRWEALEGATAGTMLLTAGLYALGGLLVVWLLELIERRLAPLVPPAAAGPALAGPPVAGPPPQFGPPPFGSPVPGPGSPVAVSPSSGPPAQGGAIPQPWTAPAAQPAPAHVPAQPYGPPVSGPPVAGSAPEWTTGAPPGPDEPPYPQQQPPPSWPPPQR